MFLAAMILGKVSLCLLLALFTALPNAQAGTRKKLWTLNLADVIDSSIVGDKPFVDIVSFSPDGKRIA